MKIFRSLLFALISLVFALPASAGTGNLLHNIQKNGEITVGVSTLTPWVMENKEGQLIGFEIDIANQLAKDLGVKVKF